MAEPVIRLDRSKPYSSVHGERTPNDPHYRVHFMQGDLPFDSQGLLVPDDGRTSPWTTDIEQEDGTIRKIMHRPLYTPVMRDKLVKRIERLKARASKPEAEAPDEPESDATDPAAGADDVNLESWLRGEASYQAFEVLAAYKKRFSKITHKLSTVVEDLVLDEKIVPEAEVAPRLLRMLEQRAAA